MSNDSAEPAAGILADYFTAEQLANEMDVTAKTIERWRMEKKGPPVTMLGRRPIYRRSSVRDWLVKQEKKWN